VELIMAIDTDRIDEAVLALLYLGLHDNGQAWKGFDWDAMNRLHEKGMISNPVSKAKSVVFTEEGERRRVCATSTLAAGCKVTTAPEHLVE
jgi:hypothetical protein